MGASSESCDVEDLTEGTYGGGRFACEIYRPASPHVSTHAEQRHGKRWINAVSVFHCLDKVDVHTVTMTLQRRGQASGWVPVETKKTTKVPPPNGAERKATVTFEGCRPGVWRARAQAHGVYEGQRYESPVLWSREKNITRRDCGCREAWTTLGEDQAV